MSRKDFERWKDRRFWLYPPNIFKHNKSFEKFLEQSGDLSDEQIEREIMWDDLIESLIKNGWEDCGKMFFRSPKDKKKYDIRDALIVNNDFQ